LVGIVSQLVLTQGRNVIAGNAYPQIPNIKISLAAAILLGYVDHRGVCAQIRAPINKPMPKSTPKPMPKKTNKPKPKKPSTMMKPTQTQLQLWRQVGFDIDGEAEYDYSGSAVSLSADGKVIAIGAIHNGYYSGHVRVYAWNNTTKKYTQRGTDIDGEAEYDYSGSAVSLSADGKILAIGAKYNDGKNGNDSGHVRVYAWNSISTKYIQRGTDIDGEAAGDRSGTSVSLSADGKVLAIGAVDFGQKICHVRVYAWNSISSKYTQRGTDIDGEAANDQSGSAVSLSADGKVLAIGAKFNDGKNGKNSGHVRVYAWNNTTKKYIQRGTDIDGEDEYDYSGSAVSLSADGKVLAIGAWLNDGKNGQESGHVRVYAWNSISTKYIQRGTDIDGEDEYDYSGSAVSLSADGKVLAIGADYNYGRNGQESGHVRVYAWKSTSTKYIQRGTDIDGEAAGDRSGTSVSLSPDGKVLAIGTPYNHGKNGTYSGHVRVYAWGD